MERKPLATCGRERGVAESQLSKKNNTVMSQQGNQRHRLEQTLKDRTGDVREGRKKNSRNHHAFNNPRSGMKLGAALKKACKRERKVIWSESALSDSPLQETGGGPARSRVRLRKACRVGERNKVSHGQEI